VTRKGRAPTFSEALGFGADTSRTLEALAGIIAAALVVVRGGALAAFDDQAVVRGADEAVRGLPVLSFTSPAGAGSTSLRMALAWRSSPAGEADVELAGVRAGGFLEVWRDIPVRFVNSSPHNYRVHAQLLSNGKRVGGRQGERSRNRPDLAITKAI